MPVCLGRTLRRGLGADPATLDPQLADDNAALAVVVDLYEGLATERPDGTIVPGAASSWTVDERGLAWTFHLASVLSCLFGLLVASYLLDRDP